MLFESKFSLQIFNTKFQWIWELHKFPSCSDMWMGGELEENKKPAPFLSPPLRSFLRNFTNSKTIGHLKEIMVRPSVQEVKKWYFSSWQVVLNPHPRQKRSQSCQTSIWPLAMSMTLRAEILIVACASSTEDTFTTHCGSGHSSEEASKK